MKQKRSEEAPKRFHVVVLRVRHTNRDGVVNAKLKNSAVIFGVELSLFSNHACHAFHDSVMIDISMVGHLYCFTVEIIHLAVYEVEAGSFHLHTARFLMVHDAARLVLHSPVCNAVSICKEAEKNLLNCKKSGIGLPAVHGYINPAFLHEILYG